MQSQENEAIDTSGINQLTTKKNLKRKNKKENKSNEHKFFLPTTEEFIQNI